MIEAHGLSDRGPVRKSNEDCFVSDTTLRLFVVADGMGGTRLVKSPEPGSGNH